MNIILASHNDHKVRELNNMLSNTDIKLQSLKVINWNAEIIEDGDTIQANAWIKAEKIWKHLGVSVVSEDTGLIVDALNGEPGVHSARYAGPEKNDSKNIEKLLEKLGQTDNRKARFKTVMALIINDTRHEFTGICEGKIGHIKTGKGGFGYDPIFIPDGYNRSFGQLPSSVKDEISHRAEAAEKLVRFLSNRS